MLRKADVVEGALELLDAEGLDALTMRKLGAALGVQAGALYRHFPGKDALLDAVAERLVRGLSDPAPDGAWDEQLATFAHRFRDALLAHRDGARVFAGTFVSEPNSNALGGAVVRALCSAGLTSEGAGWATFAGMYYVLGHCIEEQAQRLLGVHDWPAREATSPPEDPVFAEALHAVITADPGDRFAYGLELFIAGLRSRLDSETSS